MDDVLKKLGEVLKDVLPELESRGYVEGILRISISNGNLEVSFEKDGHVCAFCGEEDAFICGGCYDGELSRQREEYESRIYELEREIDDLEWEIRKLKEELEARHSWWP